MAGYTGGRIKRIKIQNFMTYDHVEIYPKKGLNLIIGLNGSGKSSIMCAICLGLAGKPQFTGRASQLSDFIKHGQQEAEIEIELESHKKNSIVICRKIKGEKCEWFLNRSLSNQNEVASAVKKFNIDTSNLCQFLPQEKVVEFSRMDKKQRLENMLQAIGEPHLFELFDELKSLHKNVCEIEQNVKKHQINKNSAEEENERISDEVQKQESRVRLKNELDHLWKQKKALIYQDIFNAVKKLKEERRKLEDKHKSLCKERDEASVQEKEIFNSYTTYSKQMEELNSQKKNLLKNLTINLNRLTCFTEQVESAKIEYKNRLAEKEYHQKRLNDVILQIEGLERALKEAINKCPNYDERNNLNSQALTQLHQEITDLYQRIEKVQAEKNQVEYTLIQLRSQLTSLQDEQNKKMANLKKRDKYTYQAACWLLENKKRFKSNVYLPIMIEVNVNSSADMKYVENVIGFKDMIAFVCEDKNDCERLSDILKNQQKLPVNIVMAPDISTSNFVSPPLTHEYRQCGLECFVIDLFTAPEPIMRYLCACYRIHSIPVARSVVPGNNIEFILQRYSLFFSENMRISGKKSRYGEKNLSVKKDFITNKYLLVNHDDELQKQTERNLQCREQELEIKKRELEEYKAQLTEKEKCHNKLRQEKKLLQDQKRDIDNIRMNYHQKKKYRMQMSVAVDEQEEKEKITKKIQSINENRERVLSDVNSMFKDFTNLEKSIIKIILSLNSLSKNLKLTEAANEDIYEKVKAANTEYENIKKEYREKKNLGERLYSEIQALGEEYVKYIEAPARHITNLSLDDVEQKISHIQAQLNLNEDNESLVAEYNARKLKIEAIQEKIDKFQSDIDELKQTIQEKKKEWLEPLQNHIRNINKKFSHYFKQLSCAGEISLDIPDNMDDFTKYGLQIKLKFHDDVPLTELSQTHHSGGECSVAAIVFILSLQELTEVPFRCIDEINQGMDSVNERKIYQLIADSVGEDRCSQYFLLTPKLLMDLEYPNDVAVHVIFNSCFLNIKLDVKNHLEIAKST